MLSANHKEVISWSYNNRINASAVRDLHHQVALIPLQRIIFLTFSVKSFILSCLLQFNKKNGGHQARFLNYKRLKLKSRVCNRLHCCYGNLLCHEIDTDLFTNCCGLKRYRKAIMAH